MPGKRITVRAPAKINLFLQITGVRADGHHELRTIFQSIALYDTLHIRLRRGPFTLQCDDPRCPSDAGNLVWRAADRVWAASGRSGTPRDAAVTLIKRIPLQAGLGGGSSDAAAALRAMASAWRVDPRCLPEMAAAIGADVPYFLEGGAVLGLDRGDLLFPLADPPAVWVVLVVPGFGVSTADAFAWWDAVATIGGTESSRSAAHLVNDLQGPVAARHPEIARWVGELDRAGASLAAMSGSGSAAFGLFPDRPRAERAARAVARAARAQLAPGRARLAPAGRPPRVVVTRTLNRTAYQRLAGIRAHRIHLPFAPRRSGHS